MQRTGSVMVVDNDATIVEMIVDVLTEEGYVAYSALDGAHALAVIARHPPALILLDMWMPDLSSADLIARVRGNGLATMPFVLMTTMPREIAPLLGLGSIACLVKPFDLDDLLVCVARYVRPVYSAEVVRCQSS